MNLLKVLVKRKFIVPELETNEALDNQILVRQLDVALMSIGFKLSGKLMEHLGKVINIAKVSEEILDALAMLLGDHIKHNTYFKKFPKNIPDTTAFWFKEIVRWFLTGSHKYGQYQHSYEEMLKYHDEFLPNHLNRFKVLNLGKSQMEEARELYHSLLFSNVPISHDDKVLFLHLSELFVNQVLPLDKKIDNRENKAILNVVRMRYNVFPLTSDFIDIMRMAYVLSGDLEQQLSEKIKFKIPRRFRKFFFTAINNIPEEKWPDIKKELPKWQRLGEVLHPHECKFEKVKEFFSVVRGEKKVYSTWGQASMLMATGAYKEAVNILSRRAPGYLFRSMDRILRNYKKPEELFDMISVAIPKVSGRVVLSLMEHLNNRIDKQEERIFINKKGKSWLEEDNRIPLDLNAVINLSEIIETNLIKRFVEFNKERLTIVYDPSIERVSIPFTEKNKMNGYGVLPIGSRISLERANKIRFFCYWHENEYRTDYDLSAMMYDKNFNYLNHLSYTDLRNGGGRHSGDLTEAHNGASEFIDVYLHKLKTHYILPTINIYSGEDFNKVKECFFGYMLIDNDQKGKPFEPKAVKMKFDLRNNNGRVCFPMAFGRNGNKWDAIWFGLFYKGMPNYNRVESNSDSLIRQARTIINRDYLKISYLLELMRKSGHNVYTEDYLDERTNDNPVIYIGFEQPENLPDNSKVYTLNNLVDLIPN